MKSLVFRTPSVAFFVEAARRLGAVVLLLAISTSSYATFHLWNITQLYSNADGTVQFIELMAYAGSQQFIAGYIYSSPTTVCQ